MQERARTAGLGLLVAIGLVGLGGGGAIAAQEATVMLNWFQLADHSPLYLARERGYYEDEGIDLSIVRGYGSGDTAKKIDLEQAEFGISDVPTVLTAISKDADLVIVGMVYDKAANNIFFYKDSGIEAVEDLVGRSIAAPPGDSHRFLWPALARHHGIDPESVTLVNVKPEGKQAIVAARNADAAFDLYTSYPIWEKVLGEGNVGNLLFAGHGIALYGHGYIVNEALTEESPELIEGFLRATYRGWQDAYHEREAAIEAMMKHVSGIDKEAYLAHFDLVLDLVITERSHEHGLGWILPELMQETHDITHSGGQMDKKLEPLDPYWSNAFSPKLEAPS